MRRGRYRQQVRIAAAIAAASLIAGACGDDGGEDPSGDVETSAANTSAGGDETAGGGSEGSATSNGDDEIGPPEVTDITFGTFSTGTAALPVMLAIEEGFFEDEGLSVTEQYLESTTAIVPLLASGDVEYAVLSVEAMFTALQAEIDLDLLATIGEGGSENAQMLWVRDDSGIETAADMEGATVGLLTVGGLGDILLGEALAEVDLTLDDVTLTEVSFSNMRLALERGDIDVGWLPGPFNAALLAEDPDDLRPVVDYADVGSLREQYGSCICANAGFAAEHPNTTARFVRAMTRAADMLAADPDFERETLARFGEFEPEIVEFLPNYPYNTDPDRAWFERSMERMIDYGQLEGPVDLDPLFGG